jgi:urease accessory protein
MSRTSQALFAVFLFVLFVVPSTAFAHVVPGDTHYHGFVDGFTHAVTGLDHVFVAILVGLWAAWRPLTSSVAALGIYGTGMAVSGLLGLGGGSAILDMALAGAGFAAAVAGLAKGRAWLVGSLVLLAAALQGVIHGMAASEVGRSAGFIAGLTVATLAIAAVTRLASQRFSPKAPV